MGNEKCSNSFKNYTAQIDVLHRRMMEEVGGKEGGGGATSDNRDWSVL